jgi:hypothetical protein
MIKRVRNGKSLQRWQSLNAPPVSLPVDAIIMPRKRGVTVIASAAEERVIKISSAPRDARFIARERMAWTIAQEAGIEAHIPAIIDGGSVDEDTYWISIQLAPNHFPFWERQRGVWRRWLACNGLPVLQRFYSAAGVTAESTASGWEAIGHKGEPYTNRGIFALVTEAREKAGDSMQYSSLTHGDLGPIHVHRTRKQWALIDWAKLGRRPLWLELFVDYLRYPRSQRYERPAFWQWLRGDMKEDALPSVLKDDITLYLSWINNWQQADQQIADLRYQMLLWLQAPLQRAHKASYEANEAQTPSSSTPPSTYIQQVAEALNVMR